MTRSRAPDAPELICGCSPRGPCRVAKPLWVKRDTRALEAHVALCEEASVWPYLPAVKRHGSRRGARKARAAGRPVHVRGRDVDVRATVLEMRAARRAALDRARAREFDRLSLEIEGSRK